MIDSFPYLVTTLYRYALYAQWLFESFEVREDVFIENDCRPVLCLVSEAKYHTPLVTLVDTPRKVWVARIFLVPLLALLNTV